MFGVWAAMKKISERGTAKKNIPKVSLLFHIRIKFKRNVIHSLTDSYRRDLTVDEIDFSTNSGKFT
jgi:hypothetical protein